MVPWDAVLIIPHPVLYLFWAPLFRGDDDIVGHAEGSDSDD